MIGILLVATVVFVVAIVVTIEIKIEIEVSISIEYFSHNNASITHHIDRQMDTRTHTPKTH